MTGMMDTFAPELFRGRTVLVLGGTSGIGLGTARAFHDLAAQVVATGATEAECVATTDAFGSTKIEFTSLDVRDGAAIRTLVAGLERLDVLVNAAGVIRRDAEHPRTSLPTPSPLT